MNIVLIILLNLVLARHRKRTLKIIKKTSPLYIYAVGTSMDLVNDFVDTIRANFQDELMTFDYDRLEVSFA